MVNEPIGAALVNVRVVLLAFADALNKLRLGVSVDTVAPISWYLIWPFNVSALLRSNCVSFKPVPAFVIVVKLDTEVKNRLP